MGGTPDETRVTNEERTLNHQIDQPRSFARGAVLDYWLLRCEGFGLTSAGGRHLGTVEEVVLDEAGRARALVVRGALLGRRQVVAIDAVESVIPAGETFTVRPARRTRRPRQSGHRAARVLARMAGAVRLGAAWTAPQLRTAFVRLTQTAAAAASRGLAAMAGATRSSARRVRRRAPTVARSIWAAARAGANWAGPRIAGIARLAAGMLIALVLFLLAVLRGVVVATWTYWTIVAREAARRRAAT